MIKVAVCDDEKLITARVEELIGMACAKRGIAAETDTFYSGSSLIEYIRQGNEYDMIYLDIEMPGMDGIEFAKHLRVENADVILIYVSAHMEYVMQLFDVDTFRFLKKPVDEEEFCSVFNKACDKLTSQNRFFHYYYNKNIFNIRLRNIVYFESKGRIVNIITAQGREEFYGKLDDVETRLKGEKIQFLRIHKSFLINMEYVEKMSYERVFLRTGEQLRISDERQKIIQKQYMELGDWQNG